MSIRKKVLAFGIGSMMATAMLGQSVLAANISVSGTAKEYEAYRLLDLSTSLKANCGHGESDTHEKDCYLYTYTVSDKYRDGLLAAVTASNFDFDIDKNGEISDRELIDGMEAMDAAATRKFADNLSKSILSLDADLTTTNKTFENAPQGYYLIYESTLDESPDSRSLIMLDTAGQEDITITSKEDVPTVEKKILIPDETAEDGYKRVDADDVKTGEEIFYEVTITMPENVADYKTYGFTVHDKGEGLKIVKAPEIYVDGKKAELSESTHTITDDCLFHTIVNKDGGQLTVDGNPVVFTKDTVITLRYSATLADDFVHGSAGNPNKVWLAFTNDPYGDTEDNTPEDKVVNFTFKFATDKVDSHNRPLEGADFELYRQNGTNDAGEPEWVKVAADNENADKTATNFAFGGLDVGTYKLVESVVPEGYTKAEDVIFEIRANYDETSDNPTLKSLSVFINGEEVSLGDDATFTVDVTAGSIGTTIVNERGVRLPGTGATSLVILTFSGAVLLIGGSVTLAAMNKRKKQAR